jgi:ribonuclease HII
MLSNVTRINLVTKDHHIAHVSRLHGKKMKQIHTGYGSTPRILMVAKECQIDPTSMQDQM